jgi:hypothetical protein
MTTLLTNQPSPGDIYLGVQIFVNGKNYGSHNGINKTKKIQFYIPSFYLIFIDELNKNVIEYNTKAKKEVIKLKTIYKIF